MLVVVYLGDGVMMVVVYLVDGVMMVVVCLGDGDDGCGLSWRLYDDGCGLSGRCVGTIEQTVGIRTRDVTVLVAIALAAAHVDAHQLACCGTGAVLYCRPCPSSQPTNHANRIVDCFCAGQRNRLSVHDQGGGAGAAFHHLPLVIYHRQ